ncbi:hypothetical protein T4D_13164 [Trichinella pseudospiralis]|uniref:Uncharacterized protein n=1 Tax=Trichinella pseudospiralis TaxID=6337 RepID=A0A0V1FMQ3_TRIPS|nr:hypothetical protein T4D_13164 [Trichinella pseudospiralis]
MKSTPRAHFLRLLAVPVCPKFGIYGELHPHLITITISGLSKPFGIVAPGRLSFGLPRTPAPNLYAGAARTPLRTSLGHPSALRTSGPLTAGAL